MKGNALKKYLNFMYLKFGRSEKGTKFEKIFHFQFNVTKVLLF